jgi:cyclopropane fatty-acyl-phospholipid synthase-like methyltransferase
VKQIEYTPAGYWDRRYREGRSSGAGSEGDEGAYKAEYVSKFIADHDVKTVVDWGCGDGQVLELVELPAQTQYIGVDVSPLIVAKMREKFAGPRYLFHTPEAFATGTRTHFDLALSLDVLFHFPDDVDYFSYLLHLFGSAEKYVMIYSTNYAGGRTARHVFRREFTPDIAERFPDWELTTVETPLREGLASFFVYEKVR